MWEAAEQGRAEKGPGGAAVCRAQPGVYLSKGREDTELEGLLVFNIHMNWSSISSPWLILLHKSAYSQC